MILYTLSIDMTTENVWQTKPKENKTYTLLSSMKSQSLNNNIYIECILFNLKINSSDQEDRAILEM